MTSNDYTLKTCHDCKAEKSLVEFHKDKDKKDGVRYRCKLCDKKYGSYYYRTKAGVASSIYGAQKDSSKRRGHPLPNYTKADFSKWLFSNKNFHILFDKWVTSGYLKNEKPS
ncbi:MAG: hypothetical protein KAT90_13340, partial [Gammaproteobacteria bacterium]|nr:hypothetical protein [Gammaproteobacteria bacterium]